MIPDPYLFRQDGADALEAGTYVIARRNRVDLPVRIWFGPPSCPDTGELLDRSPRWQIEIGGVAAEPGLGLGGWILHDLHDFWPACKGNPISLARYQYLVDLADWSKAYDPTSPFATGDRIDPLTCRLP